MDSDGASPEAARQECEVSTFHIIFVENTEGAHQFFHNEIQSILGRFIVVLEINGDLTCISTWFMEYGWMRFFD
jgi:hypothetical protein